jgi:hypothetical protein
MIAAQLVACVLRGRHDQPDTIVRAALALQPGWQALRTFAMLLDALNRHRGKGTQKITVEHVVHSSGQAIVGLVLRSQSNASAVPCSKPASAMTTSCSCRSGSAVRPAASGRSAGHRRSRAA